MEIDGNTLIFIIIVIFFIFSTPGGDGISSQYEFTQMEHFKGQYRYELEQFQNMTVDSNFRNITGFKLSYADAVQVPERNATYPIEGKVYDKWYENEKYMTLPDDIIQLIKNDIWNTTTKDNNFPPNISSSLKGKINLVSNFHYSNIRMPIPNFYKPPSDLSDNTPPEGESYPTEWPTYGEVHNVTFDRGEINIQISQLENYQKSRKHILEDHGDTWKLFNLQISFNDKGEHEKHFIDSLAVYDVVRGRILAMSNSAKFHSIFAIPHYLSSNLNDKEKVQAYTELQSLISNYLNETNFINGMTMSDIDISYDRAMMKCEYMAFLQLEPWNQYNRDQLKIIDDELEWPLGRPANLSNLPPIRITSGVFYSPDCGIHLGINDVKGERYELKIRTMRTHLLFGIALFILQIYLLLLQMQHTNTPSGINKISYYCFSMINVVDTSVATLFFMASSILQELYIPLVISAFVALLLSAIFEIRYLISIFASQVNEQSISVRTLMRGTSNDDNNNPRPTIVPDEAAVSGALYGRYFFTLIIFIFVVLSSTSWPRKWRMLFEYTAIFALNSYWFPQIYRNVIKGIPSRRARERASNAVNRRQNQMPLLWSFILGTTFIRVVPVVYVFTYSSNVFRHHKDPRFVVALLLWLAFQVTILYTQDILGARWFLPQHSIPEGYTYFKPVSSEHLKEHGNSSSENTVDCAICMSEVPVYVTDIPESHKVDQHTYMVTPCKHIFHTDCLENWMSYKLQCPICRSPLPPI